MPEFTPAVVGSVFGRLVAEGERRGRVALEPIALAIERQAKLNMGYASHRYGTPTTAVRGRGPAIVSGNGRRSITHSPIVPVVPGTWETRVGTAVGFSPPSPPYPAGADTPANKYLYYLEAGDYPFLKPAYDRVLAAVAPGLLKAAYGDGWTRTDI